ncbi:unnamed protein product [Orchesella dallaii]|uniref:Uncharacterized protein n=1 Tax=Orchesella dallaii TaxID=48710 RepID=A0ABP1R1G2_9HEXA
MYKQILPLLLLSLAYFQTCSSAPMDSKQVSLTELGTSMNVTYYVGHEEISRDAGKVLCFFNNLTLAEVHHPEQEQFLAQALSELDEFSHYHTGGRARTGLDSLVWETSNSGVNALSAVELNLQEPLCLLIRVPDYPTLWETDPCTDNWPPICQTPVSD